MQSSSLAVAATAVAATLAVQWLWARAGLVRNGHRKGYSSIEASKDPEVVHGVSRMAAVCCGEDGHLCMFGHPGGSLQV